MKAIICTQCGATIDDVSESSVIIHCNYCGARIMLDRISKPTTVLAEIPDLYKEEPTTIPTAKLVAIICASVIAIPLLVGIFLIGKPKAPPTTPRAAYSPPAIPVPTPPSWKFPTEPAKPPPVMNYQRRVSWDGPNDMESFDDPEVDISSVADLTSEQIKKTVFKNRTVKLRVVINTEGEIDIVETISGHPLLVEAATRSAKRSIFQSRTKPTTRILTYTFRLLED